MAAETGALPPLLGDVLELATGRTGLAAELKEDVVERVADLLVRFATAGGPLIVISFIDRILARLTKLAPELRTGLLLEHSAQDGIQRARACEATVVLPEMELVDEALIAEISDAGLSVVVWDFLAAKHANVLSDVRVAGVITDDVPGALAARDAPPQAGL